MICKRWIISMGWVLAGSSAMLTPSFGQTALPPTPRSAIANPSQFIRLAVDPYTCQQSVTRCGRTVIATLGSQGPDQVVKAQSREEVFTFGNGVVIYLLTVGGLEDDAIVAQRYRVAFQQEEDELRLVQVGQQQKCARTRSARWTKNICP